MDRVSRQVTQISCLQPCARVDSVVASTSQSAAVSVPAQIFHRPSSAVLAVDRSTMSSNDGADQPRDAPTSEAMTRIRARAASCAGSAVGASPASKATGKAKAKHSPPMRTPPAKRGSPSAPSAASFGSWSGSPSTSGTRPVPKRARTSPLAAQTDRCNSDNAGDGEDDAGAADAEPGKVCQGCFRAFKIDASFIAAGPPQDFVWLYPNSRGNLCRDCGSVYRIAHKHSMTTAMFLQRWLVIESNRRTWLKQLIAYLSLKVDGLNHITLAQIQGPVRMLEWLFASLQLPFPTMEVVMQPGADFFRQLTRNGSEHFIADSSIGELVGLRPPGPQMLPHASNNRFLTSSQAETAWPLQSRSSLPGSFAEAWRSGVGEHAFRGVVAAEVAIGDSGPAEQAQSPQVLRGAGPASKQRLVFEGKLAALKVAGRILIQAFVGGDCSSKEDFAPMLRKLVNLKVEVLDSAFTSMVVELDGVASVMAAAKKLSKPLKDYIMTSKRSLIPVITEPIELVHRFLLTENIKFGPEFGSTLLKCLWFKGLAASFDDSLGVLERFDYEWASDTTEYDYLASTAIQQCLSLWVLESLRLPAPEDNAAWTTLKNDLLGNTKAAITVLKRLHVRFVALGEFLIVLDAFSVILAAALQEASVVPKSVVDAKDLISNHNLAVHMKEGLAFAGVGLAISTDSDRIILSGAMDAELDDEHRLHLDALFTSGMPQLENDTISVDRKLVALNTVVGTSSMMELAISSIEGLVGILSQWSAKRISEEVPTISGAIKHVALIVSVFDDALNGLLAESWGQNMEFWKVEIDEKCFESWPPSTQSKEPTHNRVSETDIDRISEAMRIFESTLKKVASFSPRLLSDIDLVWKELARSKANRAVRDAAWHQSAEVLGALRADACLGDSNSLLQKLMDPEAEKNALVAHLMSIAETRSMNMKLDIGIGTPIKYFFGESEVGGFGGEYDTFWSDMLRGDVAQLILDRLMQPIMNSIAKFFFSKCPAICKASLGMTSEQWQQSTSCNEARGRGARFLAKRSAGVQTCSASGEAILEQLPTR